MVSIDQPGEPAFEAYDNLILGASTWFDGELPAYWDELIPEVRSLNLKNKKVAIFGLGDQVNYPDNFADGIGLLADAVKTAGATLVGLTSPKGYTFTKSKALKNNKLSGLAIDIENQSAETVPRIRAWTEQLKKEFE